MPKTTITIAIEELPILADEAALFDAASMQGADTSVVISLITNG